MYLSKIEIKNYRGIKEKVEINLSKFTSIVGKNDSGKSIVLNAIASFLDIKNYPIVESDFNDLNKSIDIKVTFYNEYMYEILLEHFKPKMKKDVGLRDFIDNIVFNNELTIIKRISKVGKKFDYEKIIIRDFEEDEFSFLYTKSEQELLELIKKYKINIPVEGKGKNSKIEKIKYIKKYCIDRGFKTIEREVEDSYKILSLLPSVELFEADYGLKVDTSFKTQTVSEIMDLFDNKSEDFSKIEEEIINEMDKEAQSIQKYMDEYVSIKKVSLEPNISWKDAIKSVSVNFQFENDDKMIPMSHKGTGYRRLFMVARFRYLAEKQKGNNIIYLIEEPETFLHPELQNDLLNALLEISENNQVIITTHSPVFVGATNIDAVILCKKKKQSKYYSSLKAPDKRDFILNIAEELGVKPYYNLRDDYNRILFVESKNDIEFFNIICEKLLNKSLKNNRQVLVLPFGGGDGNIDSIINIEFFSKSKRQIFVIIDSDKDKSDKYKSQLQLKEKLENKYKANVYLLKKSYIESYYHPRALERRYKIDKEIFDFFKDEEKVVEKIKMIAKKEGIEFLAKRKDKKIKNDFEIFNNMTIKEWEEVIEKELLEFLEKIIF